MEENINEIWAVILSDIKNSINTPTYKTWFENIVPISLKKNTLSISVSSDFAKEWFETRYNKILIDSINKHLNQSCKIKIIVDPEISKKDTGEPVSNDLHKSAKSDRTQKVSAALSSHQEFNSKYVFDTFIIGRNNEFACNAAVAVCENPGKSYNPLFIYGGVGLGKTHLLHAIGQYTLQLFPDMKVKYVSAEQFLTDFINALRDKNMMSFKANYRNNDVLLIDDIHFLEQKEASQEEFFHTFNALHNTSRQIVITSDRAPKDISSLEDRLRSRFEWGLVTDITQPDLETRIAILKKYCTREKVTMYISDDIFTLIATKFVSNIRELEGALTRVIAYSSLTKTKPDIEKAREVLKDLLPEDKDVIISASRILKEVSKYFTVSVNDITSSKRSQLISHARHVSMYLIRELTSASLPKIGKDCGNRDHPTVIYAIKKIASMINNDRSVYNEVQELTNRIKSHV
ncbi:MAG: chromosomal replication initiator protein DnaA [Actinobacteria bacterium]|nr:chromosomal replication initiator protein DnaA [Actinomycetota bacterium]